MVTYIALGLCAYLGLAVFEFASLRELGGLKGLMGIATIVLPTASFWAMLQHPEKFAVPSAVVWFGAALMLLSAGLWCYSMFVEIPFSGTYLSAGSGNRLIAHGTYALTRHPAVLWFGLFMLSLVLVTRSSLLRIAAPIWWLADALYVWGEERWYLQRVFPDYAAYQRTTPMLLPTIESLRRCLMTLRFRAGSPEV